MATDSKVIVREVVLSYPFVFEARTQTGDDGKTKVSFNTAVVGKGAPPAALVDALIQVGVDKWGEKFREEIALVRKKESEKYKWPIKPGAGKGYGEGTWFFNCSSKSQPGVVSRYKGPDGKPQPIKDPAEIYPGVIVNISVNAFAYEGRNAQGQVVSRGVSLGLGNIQKWADGPRLDNRVAAEDEFEADTEASGADLEDVL